MYWIILTLILAYLIYVWVFKPLNHWKNKKVPYSKPWPLVGNLGSFLFKRKHLYDVVRELYEEFPNERFYGTFSFQIPAINIKDLDLIKQITITDFDSFMNHPISIDPDTESFLSKTLFFLKGQEWRNMRATLSPAFTGSKMKFMFKLIADCAEQFTNYFEKDYTKIVEVEMKDVLSRFANDVIATSAFGITTDSLNNGENEIFINGKEITRFDGWKALNFFLHFVCPTLMKFLKIPVFSNKFTTFFQRVMKETIEAREHHGIVRPDMVHLLLESKRGNLKYEKEDRTAHDNHIPEVDETALRKNPEPNTHTLTDDDITAQALIFFVAGFDTVSTLSSFLSYELAVNVDVQKKLQQDIDEVLKNCNGKVTYEALMKIKYLDMVVAETLRKWPPTPAIDRICVKDYTIEAKLDHEEPFFVEKGTNVSVPVAAIHYDPKYFPNPDKFDPERFSEENKSNMVPFSYMPFGVGPRSCIASRFALMETKILFFQLLSKFNIVPIEKSSIPLKLKKSFALGPEGGFWFGFEKRNF